MQLDFAAHEVTIKLVYYGPALSGKTTNLRSLHNQVSPSARGRLMTIETMDDRTLFFDLLPLTLRSSESDLALRIKLFTVPGQPIHTATRRLVLQGADGVAFIADSRLSETEHNAESFVDLRDNLRVNNLELGELPVVIQFNKRDLDDIRGEDELTELAVRGKEPVYLAVATDGFGVVETFMGLLERTWASLERTHQLGRRLGLDGDALLRNATEQLGVRIPVGELLSRRLGAPSRRAGTQVPR